MPQWLIVLIQSLIVFSGILLFMRLMGKKSIIHVPPFFVVVYIAIGVIAALLSVNIINVVHGIIALSVWILIPIAASFTAMRNKWFHDLLIGKETVFIKEGKIMEENLLKERYTPEELLGQLRAKKVFDLANVEFAVLEPNGEVNAMLKADKSPVTPHYLGEKVPPQSEARTVILDGKIMDEPLATLGLNRQWLETELDKLGISPENIFVGQVNSFGEMYVDLFDDAIQMTKPKVRELLYATLEKVKADLYTFALDTADEKVKAIYYRDAEKLEQLLIKLRPYLLH
ncbi:MAG: DUF421 domain-containing protein [Clostridia bacterium]|nr:DUF421 domain-containing protein [Clostridia bacterium]